VNIMSRNAAIEALEQEAMKKEIPSFHIGDTVVVHTRIVEGEKERIQLFTGTVIARKGKGISESVSLYRISYGSGVERIFMLHSPMIAKIEVIKSGKVRKSKLYYLRGVFGKKSKIQERIGGPKERQATSAEAKSAAPSEETPQ
jgi:large subunit ribosomal protein L19